MKEFYRYADGESEVLPEGGLEALLERNRCYLRNYEELVCDLDDPSYVARGNGFCDAKFSEDFVDGQISKYKARVDEILQTLNLVK